MMVSLAMLAFVMAVVLVSAALLVFLVLLCARLRLALGGRRVLVGVESMRAFCSAIFSFNPNCTCCYRSLFTIKTRHTLVFQAP